MIRVSSKNLIGGQTAEQLRGSFRYVGDDGFGAGLVPDRVKHGGRRPPACPPELRTSSIPAGLVGETGRSRCVGNPGAS
jgi:hypothetical protein